MIYSQSRQTQHLPDPAATEAALAAIADALGVEWLGKSGNEPIRQLWKRRDALSTNQLVILGNSIIDSRRIDEKWTNGQIRRLKADRNNHRGAVFEIVALSMLDMEGQKVRPTRSDAPGYDATVTYANGGELALSFKNYGTSVHERRFRADATTLEETFVSHLRASGKTGLVLIAFADQFPDKNDWATLRGIIPGLIANHDPSRLGFSKGGNWTVRTLDPPNDVLPLSLRHLSHQVLITAPFHANEEKNLVSKLEEAAANARRHANGDAEIERAVLVHVPETFPLRACADWAEEYLSANPNGPINQVILHQLHVGLQKDQSVLVHTLAVRMPVEFLQKRPQGRVLAMKAHVGLVSITPSPLTLVGSESVTLERMYCYQHGEFWTDFTCSGTGHLSNPAPGIFKYAVMRAPDGNEFQIQGIFPPSGSVTLLD